MKLDSMENRIGKTYIFLKRGEIPFLPLKYFRVVVDGDIDQDEAEDDVDDDENDGSDDQHLHFNFFQLTI